MVIGRVEVPVEDAKAAGRQIHRIRPRHSLESALRRSHLNRNQEKLLRAEAQSTVLKLTQVGEASSLRRSGKRWLRNSAKWPRNFGIRGALDGSRCRGSQKISAGDCLLKTQDSANS